MVKNIIISVLLGLVTLVSSAVNATTYTFTGPNYTTVTGTYNTAMNITGSFTTLNPLPANMAYTAIGPLGSNIVTSWSFNDGLHTFNNTNSMVLFGNSGFSVSTDASGQINGYSIGLMSPVSPPVHAVTDRIDAFFINSSGATAVDQSPCINVTLGVCDSITQVGTLGIANPIAGGGPGVWAIVTPASVPSLSVWSVLLLISLFGFLGIKRKGNDAFSSF